jgi:hypothetical protein
VLELQTISARTIGWSDSQNFGENRAVSVWRCEFTCLYKTCSVERLRSARVCDEAEVSLSDVNFSTWNMRQKTVLA